eukprot:jgi/Tetstr1/460879/TSEL_006037.t1
MPLPLLAWRGALRPTMTAAARRPSAARMATSVLSAPGAASPPPTARSSRRAIYRCIAWGTGPQLRGAGNGAGSVCGERGRRAPRAGGPWGGAAAEEDSPAKTDGGGGAASKPFAVVNFYHLNAVAEPEAELQRHREFIEQSGSDIKGRIYVSAQGINAQYSAPRQQALDYARWVASHDGFESLRWHLWDVETHQFPKLRMKHRKSLVQLAGGTTSLPLLDRQQRATPLQPGEWRRMLAESRPLVLDVRNNYEWDAGHFEGAARPVEANFCETPTDLSGDAAAEAAAAEAAAAAAAAAGEEALPLHLRGVDKGAPVMMYCTGGIRCDIYSAYLQKHGFTQLYTLEGGIANYLHQEGTDHWNGSLFVFDDRLAIGPVAGDADGAPRLQAASEAAAPLPAAVPCQLCRAAPAVLPHLNCANIMCNKLFIACDACRQERSNCCCDNCTRAPRLRYRAANGSWAERTQDPVLTQYRAEESELEGALSQASRSRVVDFGG